MSDINKLIKQIEKMVEEKTLSLDAVEGLGALKQELEALRYANEALKDQQDLSTQEIARLDSERLELKQELRDLRERSVQLVNREKKMAELEIRAEFEREKTALVVQMFRTVFKPNTIRETVQKSVPVPHDGWVEDHEVTETTTTEEGLE